MVVSYYPQLLPTACLFRVTAYREGPEMCIGPKSYVGCFKGNLKSVSGLEILM